MTAPGGQGGGWVPGGPTPPSGYGAPQGQPHPGAPPPYGQPVTGPAYGQPSTGAPPQQVTTCYRHPDREAYIQCTRCGRTICPDCMRPAAVGFQCPDCVREGNRSVRSVQGRLGGAVSTDSIVTKVIIGLNVIVYIAIGLRYPQALFQGVITPVHQALAMVNGPTVFSNGTTVAGVSGGQYYRMLTSAFLHYGLIHIALNMYALWIVGSELERVLGRWRYTALYLLSALGGSLLTYLLPQSGVGAGASGAIFGLFGAYFVILRRLGMRTGGVVGLIAINLVLTFILPGIGWTAHVGGLITGLVVSAILAYAPRKNRAVLQWSGMAVVLVLIVIGTLARTAALGG